MPSRPTVRHFYSPPSYRPPKPLKNKHASFAALYRPIRPPPGVEASLMAHTTNHSAVPRNQRTRNQFRPRSTGKGGTTSHQLRQYAEATLGGGSLRKVVKLPEGEDENEWLAVNSTSSRTSPKLAGGCVPQGSHIGLELHPDWQWWTSTIRSTSYTALLPSSVHRNPARR